ncbi:13568_t:CDS:2 [Entrophospora sp. SA101]|nr:10946_t:CDS:2 [Entrophospora sp. SA101]CAJ0765413.1 13567_t:CDS:2 [Entrophospora sp. SA101]CAJ0765414.1 13568_t:CDS:2 [Entrophospora sp. SA101]
MPPPHLILAESVEIIDDSKNDTESIDIKHGEEEIRRLSLDEIDIRNKLLAILTSQQKEDKKSGKDCVSSISLNHIIDSSNNEVFKQVNNTLNENNNIHITSVQNTPAKKRNDKNQPLPSSSKSPSPGSPLQRSDLFSYLE